MSLNIDDENTYVEHDIHVIPARTNSMDCCVSFPLEKILSDKIQQFGHINNLYPYVYDWASNSFGHCWVHNILFSMIHLKTWCAIRALHHYMESHSLREWQGSIIVFIIIPSIRQVISFNIPGTTLKVERSMVPAFPNTKIKNKKSWHNMNLVGKTCSSCGVVWCGIDKIMWWHKQDSGSQYASLFEYIPSLNSLRPSDVYMRR